MKKFIYSTLILTIALVSLQSCGSDDDGDDNGNNNNSGLNNQISIDGEVFDLFGSGLLEDFGENADGSFDWDIEIEFPNGETDTFVYLDLNTNSEEGLVDGTYNFSNTREAFTIVDAIIRGNGESFISLSPREGSVEIDVDNNETTIALDLVGPNGEVILGNWSGVLTID